MEEKDNEYVQNTDAGAIAEANVGAERQERGPNTAPSAIGKFKDVDALLKAYDCLQAEFTRRSQRLKQLEREAENFKGNGEAASAVEKLRKNAARIKQEEATFDGYIAQLEGANVRAADNPTPQDEKPDLPEMADGVAQTETIVNDAAAMAIAQEQPIVEENNAPSLGEKFVANSTEKPFSSAEELYRVASGNEEVRLKIIGEYLNSVGKTGVPLTRGGGGMLSAPPIRAKSVKEAGEMALRWLQREGAKA